MTSIAQSSSALVQPSLLIRHRQRIQVLRRGVHIVDPSCSSGLPLMTSVLRHCAARGPQPGLRAHARLRHGPRQCPRRDPVFADAEELRRGALVQRLPCVSAERIIQAAPRACPCGQLAPPSHLGAGWVRPLGVVATLAGPTLPSASYRVVKLSRLVQHDHALRSNRGGGDDGLSAG